MNLFSCSFRLGSLDQAAVREASRTGASFRLCPVVQAKWLQKTAEEIRQLEVDEALCDASCLKLRVCVACLQVRHWVKAMLPRNPAVAETLHGQEVDGEALMDLTYQRLVEKPYSIAAGPAGNLAKRIAAVSAPPMAASGFQVGASAERDWKGALGWG